MSTLAKSTQYTKRYRWRKANGISIYTSADKARAHIGELHALDITSAMIADVAGRSDKNIIEIGNGELSRIQIDTEKRILSVTHHPHPNQTFVLGIGAHRRIRALNAIGWPTATLAARLGITGGALNLSITRKHITYSRWAEVRDLYDELSGTPGPKPDTASRTRYKAAPPLAWEDRDIDYPRAQPDWAAMGIKPADRPVCGNDHLYTVENTGHDSLGRRYCRTCRRS